MVHRRSPALQGASTAGFGHHRPDFTLHLPGRLPILLGAAVTAIAASWTLRALAQSPINPPQAPLRPVGFDAYVITALGSEASAINADGSVVVNQSTLAYAFTPTSPNTPTGETHALGTLGGTTCIGRGIDVLGHITGFATLANGSYTSFLWSDGVLTNIGGLSNGFSSATGIDDDGHVVGFSYDADDQERGFVWTPIRPNGTTGSMIGLGTFGGEYSHALGINAHGAVVGYAYNSQGAFHAFAYDEGQMTDLGTFGGSYSKAEAIDNQGRIVGQAYLPGNVQAHAALWDSSGIHDLGNLGGDYSEALGIDPSGRYIVGRATVPSSGGLLHYHAFVHVDGVMQDLNDFVAGDAGWELERALGVNSHGQIVGAGTWHGQSAGFLLTPR
jgi:probable HAF family extracellular repeat protein